MRIIWWTLALALLVLGLATIWLPIPTGVPLLALGSVVIIGTSRQAARAVRNRRRKMTSLNGAFLRLEERTPAYLSRILRRTRPRIKN
ncbi:hypothetical protein [Roseibium sp.]|uniref:hypothetical protein n=1 Tax=Roseibium sp. TaxID=1936156 RepID=UPI003A97A40E